MAGQSWRACGAADRVIGVGPLDAEVIPINAERACMGCHKLVEKADHTYIVHHYFADQVR